MAKTIYALINKKSNKVFIGMAGDDVSVVMDKAIGSMAAGECSNKAMQGDWDKYGPESFVRRIVEVVDDGAAESAMKGHIESSAADKAAFGYNIPDATKEATKPKAKTKAKAKSKSKSKSKKKK
tara:strand:- start:8087 stop:8458 length:372 start_codon:yes stop_codon:yes gene_type:complete